MQLLQYVAIFCTILSIVDSLYTNEGPMLLSKRTVGQNDSFTVFCNRSSFDGVKFPYNVKHIDFLAVCRSLNGTVFPVTFYSHKGENDLESWDNATEMGWSHSYTGGNVTENANIIQLNMTFGKASCADAGAYLCWARVEGTGVIYSSFSYLLPRPPRYQGDPQACPGLDVVTPIINKNVIGPGDSFTFTCDFSKFHDVYLFSKDILCMTMYKLDFFDEQPIEVFEFNPKADPQYPDKTADIPSGRNWTISCYGRHEATTMVLTVHDAKFQDAGTYLCRIALIENKKVITRFASPHYLYALDVHYGPMLINKNEVGPNDTFTMTCDITKFVDKGLAADKDIEYLGMELQLESLRKIPIAQYQSPSNTFLAMNYTRNRNWKFSYSGGDTLKGNRNKMRISVDVLDASCDDAGAYYCVIKLEHDTDNTLSTQQLLQPRAAMHEMDRYECNSRKFKPPPLLSKRAVGMRDSFEMTCSAVSFRNRVLPPSVSFERLGIVRRLATDKVDRLVAILTPGARGSDKLISLTPTGRQWTFDTYYGPNYANKPLIKITMKVRDAGCQDAGIYKCIAKIATVDRFFHSIPNALYPRGPLFPNDPSSCPYSQWTLISDLLMEQANLTTY